MLQQAKEPEQVVKLDPARVFASPFNPRVHFDQVALIELGESIRDSGQIQPIVVRPRPGGLAGDYELAVGERRWRGTQLMKLPTIDAVVRELSDLEVKELQLLENDQRKNVTALEEARGFKHLRDEGLSIVDIAARIKKSPSHVYGRLHLLKLEASVLKAHEEGLIDASAVGLLARFPPQLQVAAATEITQHGPDSDEPWSFRQVVEYLKQDALEDLDDASWPLHDVDLDKKAGACTSCPKRGANIDLPARFANVCIDLPCAQRKRELWGARRMATAKAAGLEIVSDSHATKMFPYEWNCSHCYDGEYITTADRCHNAEGQNDAERYSVLLERTGLQPHAVVRNPHTGDVVDLLRRDKLGELEEQLSQHGIAMKKRATPAERKQKAAARKSGSGSSSSSSGAAERAEKKKLAEEMSTLALRRLSEAVTAQSGDLDRQALMFVLGEISDAGDLKLHRARWQEAGSFNAWLDSLDERAMLGVLVEHSAVDQVDAYFHDNDGLEPAMASILDMYSIDLNAIRNEVDPPPVVVPITDAKKGKKGDGAGASSKKTPPSRKGKVTRGR